MANSASELARRLARRCRGGVPRLSLQWPSRRELLDRRRRPQHARPLHACAPEGERPRARRANGSTRRRASMATCSTSLRTAAASWIPRMWPTRPGAFSALPRPEPTNAEREPPAARGSPEAARRLFAMSTPSPARSPNATSPAAVFRSRHTSAPCGSIPGCYYRDLATGETLTLPALIAAVTGLDGRITGLQRTYCSPARPRGDGKAHVADPRRSLGHLLGNGVWLGLDPGMPARSWPPAKASRRWPRSGP